MYNLDFSLLLSLIGCITGIASLLINFYKALTERTKLKIEFDNNKCLFFQKLTNYSSYKTNYQGFVYIRLINKSSFPITIYDIKTLLFNKEIFFHKYKGNEIELILKRKSATNYTAKPYDMTNQVTLPIKLEPFSVFQGYMFFDFLPDSFNKSVDFKFTIKSSRKTLKKSCSVHKFVTKIDYDTN